MNIQQLSKLYHLNNEIEDIEQEITALEETIIGSSKMSGTPHGTEVSKPTEQYYLKKEKLLKILINKKNKYTEERIKLETYIDTIDDCEVRRIARHRFIYFEDWYTIGAVLHMDRTTASKKLKRYLRRGKDDKN